MRLPLQRSLVFWLGAFVFVSLLWAWQDSMHHSTRWSRDEGNNATLALASFNSSVSLERSRLAPGILELMISRAPDAVYPAGSWSGRFERLAREVPVKSRTWFPKPVLSGYLESWGGYETRTGILPYWVVALCYVPVWLLMAVWRTRRIGKARAALESGSDGNGGTAV